MFPLELVNPTQQLSFGQAFGVLGIAMLLILLVCIIWTTWLILLAYAPSWTANYLMNTEEFDEGNFWLIVETKPWVKALSLFGLGLVALCYLYVLLKMVVWRNHVAIIHGSCSTSGTKTWWDAFQHLFRAPQFWRRTKMFTQWQDLTGFSGSRRKF